MLIKPVYCHNITPFFTYIMLFDVKKSNGQSVQFFIMIIGVNYRILVYIKKKRKEPHLVRMQLFFRVKILERMK